MGRKALSGERKTDKPLKIRLTAMERARIDAAAHDAGKPTSTWVRDVVLSMTPDKPPKRPKGVPKSPRKG